jgi:hypothetical protein
MKSAISRTIVFGTFVPVCKQCLPSSELLTSRTADHLEEIFMAKEGKIYARYYIVRGHKTLWRGKAEEKGSQFL